MCSLRDKKLLAKLTGSMEALPAEAQSSLVRGSINKFTRLIVEC
ncbi:hypothetical protein J3A98_001854 [Pseudomonas sp. BP6]|nr:hypothetical protein [Pseudomonas sp. BP6]MBP2289868.1 hypothetical protein [Pseudomonas sp. BP7]